MTDNMHIGKWRGLMAGMDAHIRFMGFLVLVISAGALVFCQLGFLPLGGTRLLTVLVPITLGSLMYGVRDGTLLGAISGLAMMVHAMLLPFDYYEKYFASPINSVVLFALTGLFLGVLFALVVRLGERNRTAGFIALIAACFAGSWFASTFFQVGTAAINSLLNLQLDEEFLRVISGLPGVGMQLVLDGVITSVCAVIAAMIDVRRINAPDYERSLRETFMGWLVVVVAVAFMSTAASCYGFISVSLVERANRALDNHLLYVQEQLEIRDAWVTQVERRGVLDESQHDAMLHQSISSVATGLRLWETGITVVAEDNTIVSSSEPSYVGHNFQVVIGAGLQNGFSDSIYNSRLPLEFYIGNSAEISYLKASEISYLRAEQVGNYQIAAILPGSEVFEYRTIAMIIMSAVFFIVLALVFLLAMRLLDRVVVRSIDQTNETLERITEGDLDQMVNVRDSVEFSSLSEGINTTVNALKDSIAEVEARYERELATARAIQTSALPRTFPPFPEIDRFDIFATMEPAREVGGDFYDFFLIDDNHVGLVLADVSGKSVPAALFMMSAKTEIENHMSAGMELDQAIQTANFRLCQGNDTGMFVTVFAAVLNIQTGLLQYVNAGHNPPLLRHEGSWEWLPQRSGLFLGAFETAQYEVFEIQMEANDELLAYTDGVTEAWNLEEELYGEDRLEAFLGQHNDLRPRKLVESLRRDVLRWANGAVQTDDITMLCLEYGVAPEISASIVLPAQLDMLEQAQAFVHGELARRLCPADVQNKIDICIEELFVNVANYAYPNATPENPGKVRVSYIYQPQPRGITIQLSDEGLPFDPLAKPDPNAPSNIEDTRIGGLGIFMTKQLSDSISYTYRDNCNTTTFTKLW